MSVGLSMIELVSMAAVVVPTTPACALVGPDRTAPPGRRHRRSTRSYRNQWILFLLFCTGEWVVQAGRVASGSLQW
jgi:hypothetical protein